MGSGYEQSMSTDPEFKKRLASLCGLMSKKLGVKKIPKIVLSQNQENADKPFGNTAYYNPQEQYIKVFITERHPTDVLRSFAHELIHHWQNEHGALPPQKAHEHYAQTDPVLRKREMEAYLMGNILFRDWQDEQRYGKINENLSVKNPDKVIKTFRDILFKLVKDGAIGSYHRAGTSGDMDPNDFVEELSRKMELEIDKFLQIVNNRGNWENGQDMIAEGMTRDQVKELIRSRIFEMGKRLTKAEKKEDEANVEKILSNWKKWDQKQNIVPDKPQKGQSYAEWLQKFLSHGKPNKKAQKYYTIGFEGPDRDHFCWYWDLKDEKLVIGQGWSHTEHFGKDIPYSTFRGRYDVKTRELSVTIAEYGQLAIQKYTKDYKKDLPPKLLAALKKTFKNPKIFYFPFTV